MAKHYIDREEAIKAARLYIFGDRYEVINLLKHLPVADVRECKQGNWVKNSDGVFICSECEEPAPQRMMFHPKPFYWTCDVRLTKYCPNCGCELIV